MIDVSRLIAYEMGGLTEEETLDLFQELVDDGIVWRLQGHYGRTADVLLKAGLLRPPLDKP